MREKPPQFAWSRRNFLRTVGAIAAGAPLALHTHWLRAESAPRRFDTRVAIASCKKYGEPVRVAFQKCFDQLGGIGALVKGKTVTVKVNLTGTDFRAIADRPAHETSMTHYSTAAALASLLFENGARRVRFVESTNSRWGLETSLGYAEWDVKAMESLGKVEFENTRNLGNGSNYATLKVPGGGRLFSQLELNRSYVDTDVMISLCKLKQHIVTGMTLSLKNLFGITPNSLYGEQSGDENATKGRLNLHNPARFGNLKIPGMKTDVPWQDAESRVPRIVTDICAARPIDLAIIDGITSMSGGEGWWCKEMEKLAFVQPGVIIAGFNPVATDAVGAAVMGFDNPRAPRGAGAFKYCDNMLLLAEEAGLGTADLAKIDVRGLSVAAARYPYPELETPRLMQKDSGKSTAQAKSAPAQ